jgi:hypothetical protein
MLQQRLLLRRSAILIEIAGTSPAMTMCVYGARAKRGDATAHFNPRNCFTAATVAAGSSSSGAWPSLSKIASVLPAMS